MRPRDAARSLALDAMRIADGLRGRVRAALSVPRVQTLLFHHLFPHEVEPFRHLLRRLSQSFEFVRYADASRLAQLGSVTRPTLAFSFDDGRQSCMTAAAVLEEFNARGCFFVCPSMVGEQRADHIRRFCHDRLHFPATPFMNWDDLASLRDRGHEIGNHTWSHVDLGAADATAATEEVRRAHLVIIDRLGECSHFAWPYGQWRNVTREAVAVVRSSGHVSCASAVRGVHRPGHSTSHIMLRENVVAAWPVRHVEYLLARSTWNSTNDIPTWALEHSIT